jgi:hypothetical protein
MGFKCVALVAALIVCMAVPSFATMPLGPKSIVKQQFPTPNMSGYGIMQDVTYGSNPAANDSELSFRNESLFIISKSTGMTPGIGAGVRTPVVAVPIASVAGSWSLKLTDVNTKLLTLTLFQSGDAVFGSGELAADSSVSQVTAGGTILGDQLALFVTPVGAPNNLYRLSLTIAPGSMDGSYIYSAPGTTLPGVAFGNTVTLPAQPLAQQVG